MQDPDVAGQSPDVAGQSPDVAGQLPDVAESTVAESTVAESTVDCWDSLTARFTLLASKYDYRLSTCRLQHRL